MSLTSLVPDFVPLELHSSTPKASVWAWKNTLPLTFVKSMALDENSPPPTALRPKLMSRTRLVPSAVPLDFHNSRPLFSSLAVKNSLPLTFAKLRGYELRPLARVSMSFTSNVPALVPLDFHSSLPWLPSLARKNNVPLTLVSCPGSELSDPARMFFTSTVPAPEPLVFHNSRPWLPSSAEKKSRP